MDYLRLGTPSESTLWAKTLSSTEHIKQYRQVPQSGTDSQISFDKCSMRRDSGGMEDMSNPPTVNWRSINSKRIHHQPTEKCWIHLWDKWIILGRSKVCCKANIAIPTHNYSSTGHEDDFPVTVSTYSGCRPTHAVVDTDGPSYIEYYVSVLGAFVCKYVCAGSCSVHERCMACVH